jgi:hypothetical protein
MRKALAAAFLVAGLWSSPAFAAPLGGVPQSLAGRFNEAAAVLGMDQRIALKQCQDSAIAVCSFNIGPGTSLIAVSERHGEALDAVFAIFEGAQAHKDLASVLWVTMELFAPSASEVERRIAVRTLARDLDVGARTSATLDGVTYHLAALRGQTYRLAIMRS